MGVVVSAPGLVIAFTVDNPGEVALEPVSSWSSMKSLALIRLFHSSFGSELTDMNSIALSIGV